MSANSSAIVNSILVNGYSINMNGGVYRRGKPKSFEAIAFTAGRFFELEQQLQPGDKVSLRSLGREAQCSTTFAKKVIEQIENGELIDPATQILTRARGAGVMTLSYDDGLYLLFLRSVNNCLKLREYTFRLAMDRGTIVSYSVVSRWFTTAFPFKGGMRKLNKDPIDKFTDNNTLRRMVYLLRASQVPTDRFVFGDEKPLKGGDLFNRVGRADPITGLIEDFVVDSDWRNTYSITGLCCNDPGRTPFSYVIHDSTNDSSDFSAFIMMNLASNFLQRGDFLVLDNASIHRYQQSDGLEEYLWNYHGIFLQFLPTRSPELNPIELLWNTLAQRLKHLPIGSGGPCKHRVANGAVMLMNAFTHEDVDASYRKCGYID